MIEENQIIIDWLYDTGDLAIIIQPKIYNLRDMDKTDYYNPSLKEIAARAEFEKYRKQILKLLNNEDMK